MSCSFTSRNPQGLDNPMDIYAALYQFITKTSKQTSYLNGHGDKNQLWRQPMCKSPPPVISRVHGMHIYWRTMSKPDITVYYCLPVCTQNCSFFWSQVLYLLMARHSKVLRHMHAWRYGSVSLELHETGTLRDNMFNFFAQKQAHALILY